MKHTNLACLAVAGALLASGAASGGIIQDFKFNEPAGTLLGAAVNDASAGNNWLVHASTVDSATNGAGAFRIKKQSLTNQASNALEIANVSTGKIWLVAEIAGWNYSATASSPSERMRFAFLDNDPAAVGTSTVTAEMTIDRSGNGLVLSGEALGNLNSPIVSDYALPLVKSTPLKIVLELDKTANTYSVYYEDGAPAVLLGSGSVGERSAGVFRDARSVRFAFTGTFGDTVDEFFDIDRIYVTDVNPIPEPATMVFVALAGCGLSMLRKRSA